MKEVQLLIRIIEEVSNLFLTLLFSKKESLVEPFEIAIDLEENLYKVDSFPEGFQKSSPSNPSKQ